LTAYGRSIAVSFVISCIEETGKMMSGSCCGDKGVAGKVLFGRNRRPNVPAPHLRCQLIKAS